MGARENKVETYLKQEVKKLGGTSRKWVSPGHDGVNDQILFVPHLPAFFVEVKTIDGTLSPVQKREHARLRKTETTSRITTVYGHADVDKLIGEIKFQQELEMVKL